MSQSVLRLATSPLRLPLAALALVFLLGFGSFGCNSNAPPPPIFVNSLEDTATPAEGVITLRSALAAAKSQQPIFFDPSLDGGTIALSIIGEPRTVLPGEVMGIRIEESGPVSYLVGWFERDYGASALYARKDVVIDASPLPSGLTIAWTGGDVNPARVLAVYGDLILRGVTITGGRNVAEDIDTGEPDAQPWSLARGGGLAVWGAAYLSDCRIHDNAVEGDFDPSRDRGAFGGGVYANLIRMERCVVSGNSVLGLGAAGGGVFSVGGAATYSSSTWIVQSSVTGNRATGLFTYGGGVYTDGGGIGNSKRLEIENSTIARNIVEPAPESLLPPPPPPPIPAMTLDDGYWRGGGVYMSNGALKIKATTIVENQTHGVPRIDSLDRPNLAGGVAATIGNAHAVEDLMVGHSIIAGNTVHEVGGVVYEQDVFTGSLFYFRSLGYSRFSALDFSQMLVPVGQQTWRSLSRRHYPQPGDVDGVALEDVVDLAAGITRSTDIVSVGVDEGEFAVLHYAPMGSALDIVPVDVYAVGEVLGEYAVRAGGTDDFLAIVLSRLETEYGLDGFAADFTADFEDFLQSVDLDDETVELEPYRDPSGDPILTLADTHWFGPPLTWPKMLYNHPWIHFWHRLDVWLLDEEIPGMGPEAFGDDVWRALFPSSGPLVENPDITVSVWVSGPLRILIEPADQLGDARPAGPLGDAGAIEVP